MPDRVADLVEANRVFAETWHAPPTMTQMRAKPNDGVLCLTCMDPRVVPEQFLGGKERIAVFRNAGGHANPDVVRTINVVSSLIAQGQKVSVMVVHHTDCGMSHLTNDSIAADVAARLGIAGGADKKALDQVDFGCFAAEDLEKSVLDDVAILKRDLLVGKGIEVRGFVLSTDTGLLKELETASL